MKKLLCVLMFGMVFGQTELETRLYQLDSIYSEYSNNELFTLNIDDLVGFDLQNANLHFNSFSIIHWESGHFLRIQLEGVKPNDDIKTFASVTCWEEYDFCEFESLTPLYSGYEELRFSINGASSQAKVTFQLNLAITAEFPNDDTGLQGDMNGDDSLDVLDVVVMIDIILEGGVGDVGSLINIVNG